ncbi:MAG: YadA-like family protein, partial [Moraxella sp.]|nr:YadA-like family protein [Moraxella sp.]
SKVITNVASGGDVATNAANIGDVQKAIDSIKDSAAGGGFGLKAQDGNSQTASLGGTIEVVGADKNISTKVGDNKVQIELAKDLTLDSITAGDTLINNTGLTITGGPSVTKTGINAGDTKITNVAAGTDDTDAVNVGQLNTAINNITVTNNNTNTLIGNDGDNRQTITNTIINEDGTTKTVTVDKVAVDDNGNPLLVTYNVKGRTEFVNNSVITAVKNMNEQGIKFFHTNDGTVEPEDQAQNSEDSSAAGRYSTAIGYNATATAAATNGVVIGNKASVSAENAVAIGNATSASAESAVAMGNGSEATGVQSIAIGDGSKATGTQSIAIGTKNTVTGNNSGAFGDPTVVTGDSSYSVGNRNTISTNNTYALGSDITATAANSVFLGDNSAVFAQEGSNLNMITGVHTATADSNYTYAGANDTAVAGVGDDVVGVVSVGNATESRQVQGVAAGVVSANSTDAINGSQLYYTNEAIQNVAEAVNNIQNNFNQRLNDVEDGANAGVSSAMAMAALPQAYLPGKSMITGGMATYNGEGAVAVGFSKLSDNGRWVLKISGSADTQGNAGGAVGAGFHF